MTDQFQTISSPAKNMKVILVVWCIMSALALFALQIAVVTCIFFEVIILLVCAIMLLITSKTKWILDFQGSQLTITNTANRQCFSFDKLALNDFVFSQTARQKAGNRGHLKIKGSSAVFNDVSSFEEMKAYIQVHFS